MNADAALLVRAAAARELVVAGEVDGPLALSYVILPTVDLEQASERKTSPEWSDTARARAVQLVADGASWSQAAAAIGCSKASVGAWVHPGRVRRGRLDAAA